MQWKQWCFLENREIKIEKQKLNSIIMSIFP